MWSTLPSKAKAAPRPLTIYYAITETTLGVLLVATESSRVCLIALEESESKLTPALHSAFPAALIAPAKTTALLDEIARHVEDPCHSVARVPMSQNGTPFQQEVWTAISAIPLGETRTYTQLAQRIGRPTAVRAVAQACGKNNLALIIPCHRVVGSDGSLTGYRWGAERKKMLLDRERAAVKGISS